MNHYSIFVHNNQAIVYFGHNAVPMTDLLTFPIIINDNIIIDGVTYEITEPNHSHDVPIDLDIIMSMEKSCYEYSRSVRALNDLDFLKMPITAYYVNKVDGYDYYTKIMPYFNTTIINTNLIDMEQLINNVCKTEVYKSIATIFIMNFITKFVNDHYLPKKYNGYIEGNCIDRLIHGHYTKFNHSGVAIGIILLHLVAIYHDMGQGPYIVDKKVLDEYKYIVDQVIDTPTDHIYDLLDLIEIGFYGKSFGQVFDIIGHKYELFFREMQIHLPPYVSNISLLADYRDDDYYMYYTLLLYLIKDNK